MESSNESTGEIESIYVGTNAKWEYGGLRRRVTIRFRVKTEVDQKFEGIDCRRLCCGMVQMWLFRFNVKNN